MKRCKNISGLSYIGRYQLLFEDEEARRWLTVDRIIALFTEYTGNGIITGWQVSADGLDISVTAGSGIASKCYGYTDKVTEFSIPDNATSYVYARFNDSERLDIWSMSPAYDDSSVEVTHGLSQPSNSGLIAVLVANNGVVTITQEEPLSVFGTMLSDILYDFKHHVHDGNPISKINLSRHVTGLLGGEHLGDIDGSLITGDVPVSSLPLLNHIGLWYEELSVDKEFATTEDYFTYFVKGSWPVGNVPGVWRNGELVDSVEYSYSQDDRTITFISQQGMGSEIEVATEFLVYTANITMEGRENVEYAVYKNATKVTNYAYEEGENVVTFTFNDENLYSDKIVVCAERYFISDVNSKHYDIDYNLSRADACHGLSESETLLSVILQDKLANKHLYGDTYPSTKLFTFGEDSYDEVNSTIPEPDQDNKYLEVPGGLDSVLLPDLGVGNYRRTKYEDEKLKLDLPGVAINIVIDRSNSMTSNDPLDLRIAAAKNLVASVLSEFPEAKFSIITFDEASYTPLYTATGFKWSSDINEINAAIDTAKIPSGGTNYYDAIFLASEYLSDIPNTYGAATVLFTDGKQGAAVNHTVEQGIKAHNSYSYYYDTPIYCVGLGDNVDLDVLLRYARETGGSFFYCLSAEYMEDVADFILYGDSGAIRTFCSGYWYDDYDFGEDIRVRSLDAISSIPSGCSVVLGYQYSLDGTVWSSIVEDSTVNIVARYWRFYVYLYGNSGTGPEVSRLDVNYVDPSPLYMWFNMATCSRPIFEVFFQAIVDPYPDTANVELGIWHSGEKTWDNCIYVGKYRDITPLNLWRHIITESDHYEDYQFVLKLTNLRESPMRIHDVGLIYNYRGVY